MSLSEFLLKLAKDAAFLARFQKRPLAVLEESGLSEEDKHLILAGDANRIRAAINTGDPTAAGVVVVVVVAVIK